MKFHVQAIKKKLQGTPKCKKIHPEDTAHTSEPEKAGMLKLSDGEKFFFSLFTLFNSNGLKNLYLHQMFDPFAKL